MRLARDCCSAFLPALEAIPVKLVSGADLVREAISIEPALLLSAPAAIPRELDRARVAGAFHDHGSYEVRATGARVDMDALDRPFGMFVEQLCDETDHLDARNVAREGDRGRLRPRRERDEVGLETIAGARARKDLFVYGHERNISKERRLFAVIKGCTERTKLTAESAQRGVE